MSDKRSEAWTNLATAATAFAAEALAKPNASALSSAAYAWAEANGYVKRGETRGTNGNKLRSGKTLPFGRQKGVAIEEVDDENLRWVLGRVRESLDDPSKDRFRAANAELADAIEKELETR